MQSNNRLKRGNSPELQELKTKHLQLSNERQHLYQRTETLTVEKRKLSATFDSNNNQINTLQQEQDLLVQRVEALTVKKQKLMSGFDSQHGHIITLEEQSKEDKHRIYKLSQENTRLKEQMNKIQKMGCNNNNDTTAATTPIF